MNAWLIDDHARERCSELRAEAERHRLAYGLRGERLGIRRHLGRTLLAFGSFLTAAGMLVADEVPVNGRRSVA